MHEQRRPLHSGTSVADRNQEANAKKRAVRRIDGGIEGYRKMCAGRNARRKFQVFSCLTLYCREAFSINQKR
jgi:hypothetical protein